MKLFKTHALKKRNLTHKPKSNPIFIFWSRKLGCLASLFLEKIPVVFCCWWQRHLASNVLNDKAVDWVSMNLSYVATAEAFDKFLSQQVGSRSCEAIGSSSSYLVLWCSDVNVFKYDVYICGFLFMILLDFFPVTHGICIPLNWFLRASIKFHAVPCWDSPQQHPLR